MVTEGRLVLEFTFDDLMRIRSWHFMTRQHHELVPRSVAVVQVCYFWLNDAPLLLLSFVQYVYNRSLICHLHDYDLHPKWQSENKLKLIAELAWNICEYSLSLYIVVCMQDGHNIYFIRAWHLCTAVVMARLSNQIEKSI